MKLLTQRMRQADFDRVIWSITPEQGTTLDEILNPVYWSHVAKNLKPFARIEVLPEDKTWFAELIVVSAGDKDAIVKVLQKIDLVANASPVESDKYFSKFGGAAKWRVFRKEDNEVMASGLTKDEADAWIKANS